MAIDTHLAAIDPADLAYAKEHANVPEFEAALRVYLAELVTPRSAATRLADEFFAAVRQFE